MSRFVFTLTFLSILLGCATTSQFDTRVSKRLSPPLPTFQKKWKNAALTDLAALEVGKKEHNILWWKSYNLAAKQKETDKTASCKEFRTLAGFAEFPLHDLALLRAYEVCPPSEELPQLPTSVAPWYRELLVEIKHQEAKETEDLKDDVDVLVEKARMSSNRKTKEELYLQALPLAEKLGQSEQVAALKAALYKNSPRLNPAPTHQELNSVAADYRYHREFDKALATYQKIFKSRRSSLDDQFHALKSIRITNKVAQRRNEYINATVDLVNWTKKQYRKNKGKKKKDQKAIERFHDSQILLARTLWTEDQNTRAMKVLNESHRLLRGTYSMDEVFFIMGRIYEEKGDFKKALEYFEASYKEPVSQSDIRDRIAWLKSWNYFKLEKWEEAKTSFEQMRDSVKEPSDKSRARFWLARTLVKLNQTAEAETELRALQKEDTLGYYGMLAYRDLKESFPPLKVDTEEPFVLSLLNMKELDASTRLTIEWLISVNEKSFAEGLLNKAVEDLKKQKVTEESAWLAISSGYARTGLYLPLFVALSSLDASVKDRLLNDHPDLLFPQSYADIIAEASEKSGIPQEFIFSIIRQESAFNPEARSPADAFGLMQLLPSVAKALAQKNNLDYEKATDLFVPEINVPLGAFELKTLMKKYNNQFILAVSGYNANAGAIRGWLKTRYRDDAVEFIEEVPYEETRTYIKLVMRNYVFYQRLLQRDQSIQFPEELLALSKL